MGVRDRPGGREYTRCGAVAHCDPNTEGRLVRPLLLLRLHMLSGFALTMEGRSSQNGHLPLGRGRWTVELAIVRSASSDDPVTASTNVTDNTTLSGNEVGWSDTGTLNHGIGLYNYRVISNANTYWKLTFHSSTAIAGRGKQHHGQRERAAPGAWPVGHSGFPLSRESVMWACWPTPQPTKIGGGGRREGSRCCRPATRFPPARE